MMKQKDLIEEAIVHANTYMGHEMDRPNGSLTNQHSVCRRCQCAVRVDRGDVSGSALDTPCSNMSSNELPGDMT